VSQREALRDRIKQHVARHLADPGLTVNSLAQALGCSRRQLYNAFAQEPDGVAGYILGCRLAACHQALADPRRVGCSITDIALDHGFSNPAHFSRVFRGHYGLSPSDHRQRRK
jgi:AraC-like DNA-binding protein